jgi:O-acetyl-ADP-ribose deacetylase (regulator of RNase III)
MQLVDGGTLKLHREARGPYGRTGVGGWREDELLASCYRRSLELAARHGLRPVAFPAISTGTYGFPPDRAARIAVATLKGVLGEARRDPEGAPGVLRGGVRGMASEGAARVRGPHIDRIWWG